MTYNKKNYYKRVIEIQEFTKEYQAIGLNNKHIYDKYVKNRYFICKRTFDEYLGIPAKRELNKLQEAEQVQIKLMNDLGTKI